MDPLIILNNDVLSVITSYVTYFEWCSLVAVNKSYNKHFSLRRVIKINSGYKLIKHLFQNTNIDSFISILNNSTPINLSRHVYLILYLLENKIDIAIPLICNILNSKYKNSQLIRLNAVDFLNLDLDAVLSKIKLLLNRYGGYDHVKSFIHWIIKYSRDFDRDVLRFKYTFKGHSVATKYATKYNRNIEDNIIISSQEYTYWQYYYYAKHRNDIITSNSNIFYVNSLKAGAVKYRNYKLLNDLFIFQKIKNYEVIETVLLHSLSPIFQKVAVRTNILYSLKSLHHDPVKIFCKAVRNCKYDAIKILSDNMGLYVPTNVFLHATNHKMIEYLISLGYKWVYSEDNSLQIKALNKKYPESINIDYSKYFAPTGPAEGTIILNNS